MRRKCGNRDLEKLENWYVNSYSITVNECKKNNIRILKPKYLENPRIKIVFARSKHTNKGYMRYIYE
jgi:hypothetical protein